jgi:hypothetical protein
MKILKTIPAYLLGIAFLVFGLNFFFHFFPTTSSTPPPELAQNFSGAMYSSGYLTFVKVIEVASAVLLLIRRTQALGLILIAPITVGITAFDTFLLHQQGIGLLLLIINAIGIIVNTKKYLPIVQ